MKTCTRVILLIFTLLTLVVSMPRIAHADSYPSPAEIEQQARQYLKGVHDIGALALVYPPDPLMKKAGIDGRSLTKEIVNKLASLQISVIPLGQGPPPSTTLLVQVNALQIGSNPVWCYTIQATLTGSSADSPGIYWQDLNTLDYCSSDNLSKIKTSFDNVLDHLISDYQKAQTDPPTKKASANSQTDPSATTVPGHNQAPIMRTDPKAK